MTPSPVLVTGANGFIGRACRSELLASGMGVREAVRELGPGDADAGRFAVGDIGPGTDWQAPLRGCAGVLHLANRAHADTGDDPAALDLFRRINVAGSLRLLEQAAGAGVRRFVYVSSIAVYGRAHDGPCRPETPPRPDTAYARSKVEAEAALADMAGRHGIELVVVRPPLVYGPGVKANFLALVRAVERGLPLPFACVANARSLVSVRNLAHFLKTSLVHPAAPGLPLLVSDGRDWATPDLVRAIAGAVGRPARLWPIPPALLGAAARLTGRAHLARSLLGSLQADAAGSHARIGWQPRQDAASELHQMVQSIHTLRECQ